LTDESLKILGHHDFANHQRENDDIETLPHLIGLHNRSSLITLRFY
jgi:hypothetical protein